ncbi:MAG: glycosyltransferase [Pseudobdellovibrio sp.]
MKVLNVSYTLDNITGGGVAERSFQLSKFLSLHGENCHLLTLDTGGATSRKDFLGKTKLVVLPCLIKRFYLPKISWAKLNSLVADADIIHLIGHWSFLNMLVYLIIRRHKKPYAVCPAGALRIFGRSKFIKLIYNFVIGKSIIKNASLHIAITEDEIKQFAPYGVTKKIYVIPNGIDAKDFQSAEVSEFKNKYNLNGKSFILFLGRLNLIKGPDLLLQAFCNIKDKFPLYDLVFVGPDGGLLAELKKKAQEFSASNRVHFLGHLGGADKSNAYHAADLLVIPSRQEAMSIVALEAGICGTPVLLTDQCGFDELAIVGAGWVTPATAQGIQTGLASILSDSNERLVAASKIKEFVAQNFTWELIVKKSILLFSEAIKAFHR